MTILFRRGILFLTLLAACVLSVLPAGQLPRIAGHCGKALCECPIEESVAPIAKAQTCSHCVVAQPTRYLTLHSDVNLRVAEEHIAFFPALSACSMPERMEMVSLENSSDAILSAVCFSLSSVVKTVAVPPPRS